jgi:hypothetical protein
MLSAGTDYAELGHAYLDQLAEKRITTNLIRRLERLGCQVQIERKAA